MRVFLGRGGLCALLHHAAANCSKQTKPLACGNTPPPQNSFERLRPSTELSQQVLVVLRQ